MAESYAIIISNLAEKDLKGIFNYLQENVGVQTAINIRQAFLEKIKDLKKMPSAHGLVLALREWPTKKYRRVIVKKSWQVIYEMDEEDKVVYVIRILHIRTGPDFIKELIE